jgi:hypothetical protein
LKALGARLAFHLANIWFLEGCQLLLMALLPRSWSPEAICRQADALKDGSGWIATVPWSIKTALTFRAIAGSYGLGGFHENRAQIGYAGYAG